jgi:4-hydroxybenzoate polyprenyltransferase/phosphoserine phosphatase
MGRLPQHDHGSLVANVPPPEDAAPALFVDLDGTLIRTDLLHEAVLVLFKQSPGALLRALFRLADGRAAFKRAVSEAVTPEIRQLPFREDVLAFITEQRALGRKIILATASDSAWAHRIADELGVFDNILASDGANNLKGSAKLEAIQAYCREHGYAAFDYLGDSRADLPIWREARRAYMVAPSARLLGHVQEFAEPAAIFGASKPAMRSVLAALRPQQWVKNVLIFVPLVASHEIVQMHLALAAVVAFVCFCLCASAVYVLNDLADIGADRHHPTKRERPFASGALPVSWGVPLASGLLIVGFVLSAFTLPAAFSAALGLYFLATCAYSFFAKRIVMLDVLVLAGLYTIRVLAGGAATGIAVSEWLMAFSMFLFVSLAFAKRYAELERLARLDEVPSNGRGYHTADIGLIESMGPASGYIAVLVLALYINGEQVKTLYHNPWSLWLVCPVLMYWISRVWIKAKRGELCEDPIVFTLHDRVSRCLALLTAGLLVAASLL